MSGKEIRIRNRAKCEAALRRYRPEQVIGLEPLHADTLSDTPFPLIAALVWAYRELEKLETPDAS